MSVLLNFKLGLSQWLTELRVVLYDLLQYCGVDRDWVFADQDATVILNCFNLLEPGVRFYVLKGKPSGRVCIQYFLNKVSALR